MDLSSFCDFQEEISEFGDISSIPIHQKSCFMNEDLFHLSFEHQVKNQSVLLNEWNTLYHNQNKQMSSQLVLESSESILTHSSLTFKNQTIFQSEQQQNKREYQYIKQAEIKKQKDVKQNTFGYLQYPNLLRQDLDDCLRYNLFLKKKGLLFYKRNLLMFSGKTIDFDIFQLQNSQISSKDLNPEFLKNCKSQLSYKWSQLLEAIFLKREIEEFQYELGISVPLLFYSPERALQAFSEHAYCENNFLKDDESRYVQLMLYYINLQMCEKKENNLISDNKNNVIKSKKQFLEIYCEFQKFEKIMTYPLMYYLLFPFYQDCRYAEKFPRSKNLPQSYLKAKTIFPQASNLTQKQFSFSALQTWVQSVFRYTHLIFKKLDSKKSPFAELMYCLFNQPQYEQRIKIQISSYLNLKFQQVQSIYEQLKVLSRRQGWSLKSFTRNISLTEFFQEQMSIFLNLFDQTQISKKDYKVGQKFSVKKKEIGRIGYFSNNLVQQRLEQIFNVHKNQAVNRPFLKTHQALSQRGQLYFISTMILPSDRIIKAIFYFYPMIYLFASQIWSLKRVRELSKKYEIFKNLQKCRRKQEKIQLMVVKGIKMIWDTKKNNKRKYFNFYKCQEGIRLIQIKISVQKQNYLQLQEGLLPYFRLLNKCDSPNILFGSKLFNLSNILKFENLQKFRLIDKDCEFVYLLFKEILKYKEEV